MPLAALSAADQPLYELVTGPECVTIADVIAHMEAIDALRPVNDGLKWFNQLYMLVTKQVDLNPPGGAWKSPIWLAKLDVVFAGLYFSAVAGFVSGQTVPKAWQALLEGRYATGIDRIQFALAGLNAHINHDLALALLTTDAALNVVPGPNSLEYADYEAVNGLLRDVTPAALMALAKDTLGVLAQDTGKIGRILSFWDLVAARQAAWAFANHLRGLSGLARTAALAAQDGLTGTIGRAIVAMV
jgi:hypothetical protein